MMINVKSILAYLLMSLLVGNTIIQAVHYHFGVAGLTLTTLILISIFGATKLRALALQDIIMVIFFIYLLLNYSAYNKIEIERDFLFLIQGLIAYLIARGCGRALSPGALSKAGYNIALLAFLIIVAEFLKNGASDYQRFQMFGDAGLASGGSPTQIYSGFAISFLILRFLILELRSYWFGGATLGLLITALILFGSRTSVIAISITCCVLVFLPGFIKRRNLKLLSICIFLAITLSLYVYQERLLFMTAVFSIQDDLSTLNRVLLAKEAFERFLADPFFGYGAMRTWGAGTPHNLTLHLLADLGIIGFTIFTIHLLILFNQIRKAHNYSGTIGTIEVRSLSVLVGYFIFVLISQQGFGGIYTDIYFYILSGLLSGATSRLLMQRKKGDSSKCRILDNSKQES